MKIGKKFIQKLRTIIERLKKINPVMRIGLGLALLIFGLIALFTPLTPGSWLAIIGLEILGVHIISKRVNKKNKSKKISP